MGIALVIHLLIRLNGYDLVHRLEVVRLVEVLDYRLRLKSVRYRMLLEDVALTYDTLLHLSKLTLGQGIEGIILAYAIVRNGVAVGFLSSKVLVPE
jgi:hypothetical protein